MPGWESVYEVSDQGRVRSLKRKAQPTNNSTPLQAYRVRKLYTQPSGYVMVSLSHKGQQKKYYISRLVALAFLPNPDGKCCVNHKDGDKANNRLENLEWVTRSENLLHAIDTGLKPAKLTFRIAEAIRKQRKKGKTLAQLARAHDITEMAVSYVVNCQTWVRPESCYCP